MVRKQTGRRVTKPDSDYKSEFTDREVIANKLLTTLEMDDKVAIIATEDDLNKLIHILIKDKSRTEWKSNMLLGLRRLRHDAFGTD